MTSGRGVVRDSIGFAGSQYLARAVLVARGLVSAVALGPAGFGAWNALMLILDYGNYAPCGTLYGLDLRLPPLVAKGDAEAAVRAQRGAWSVAILGGTLFSLLVIAYLSSGSWLTLTGWGWGPPLLCLAAVAIQLAFNYHATALRARGEFTVVSAAVTLQAALGGGLGLATVWRAGVWGLLWGWLLGGVAALVLMRRSAARPPLRLGAPGPGVALAFEGFPLYAFFLLTLVLRSVDRIALVRFGGNGALGHYGPALIASGLVLYLPEAVASVLFPRIAAAAGGARDPQQTREQVRRAQRAVALVLPFVVGLGALWAEPVVSWLLPRFAPGIAGLRILAVGALCLAAATLPGYYLLGSGQGRRILPWAAAAVLVAAVLVFTTAGRAPQATAVAIAAALGQGVFALTMLALGARALGPEPGEPGVLIFATLWPTLWGAALMLGLSAWGPAGIVPALWRSAAFALGYAPVVLRFGRGLGLLQVIRSLR